MLNLLKTDVSEPTSAPLTWSSFNFTHKAIVLILRCNCNLILCEIKNEVFHRFKKIKNDLLTISVLKTKRVTIHVHCTQESCRYCKERGSVTKNDVAATCNSRAKHFVLTIPMPHLQASARFFRHKSNTSFFHYKSNYLLLSAINSVGCQVHAAVRVIKLTLRQGQGRMMCFVAIHFSVADKSSMYLNSKILYNYQL